VKNLLINIDESVHALAVRPCQSYWEILCSPGPLAHLLHDLAQETTPLRTELVEGKLRAIIPLTPILDAALVNLIDTFITLRYETGQVQLELFSLKEV
jgi:hypothetical protein